jgi:hypothetical protein
MVKRIGMGDSFSNPKEVDYELEEDSSEDILEDQENS